MTATWRHMRDQIMANPSRRWSLARGGIGATIATLLDLKWKPMQPDYWVAPGDQIANLEHQPWANAAILEALAAAADKCAWAEASKHFAGQELDEGPPSFAAYHAVKKCLIKDAAWDVLACLDAIVAGGSSAGCKLQRNRACPRCGELVETSRHRIYECTHNSSPMAAKYPWLGKTSWLVGQAREASFKPEVFWMRGLISHSMAGAIVEEYQNSKEELWWSAGAPPCGGNEGRRCELFTDGSGGPRFVHKSIQQVGAGAAWLNIATTGEGADYIESVGIVCSSVPGRQTVPRAETHAPLCVRRVLQHSHARGCAAFDAWEADATYVTSGVAKHLARANGQSLATGVNGDVWSQLEGMVDDGSLPVPVKVKAHTSLAEASLSTRSWIDFLGNSLADCAAGAAAATLIPDGIWLKELERAERRAFHVLIRAASAEALAKEFADTVPQEYELHPRVAQVTTAACLEELIKDVASQGHVLHRRGKFYSCQTCGFRRSAKILAQLISLYPLLRQTLCQGPWSCRGNGS